MSDAVGGCRQQERSRFVVAAWYRPALVMFAVGYGANQFVPLLAVYRSSLALSDAQATAIFGVYALGTSSRGCCSPGRPATVTAGVRCCSASRRCLS